MPISNKTRFQHFTATWWLPAVIAVCSLLLQMLAYVDMMRYEHRAVQQGAVWRLLTGNYVHLGWSHYFLNMLGLALIWYLFGTKVQPSKWMITMVITSLAVGLGLYFLTPGIAWYVGLSGVLHGMFVVGLLLEKTGGRVFKAVFFVALAAKLLWEQISGALPGSIDVVGGAVVVDAHLYGAIGGLMAVVVLKFYARITLPSGSCSK